jgi:uncharacterized membrane protein YgdD (TMEM256/DUF423 family)
MDIYISVLISVFQQVFNGIALLAISLHPRFGIHKFAGPAILVGSSIFSGTVMALVLNRDRYPNNMQCTIQFLTIDRFRFLGPITPIGASIMIAGYVSLQPLRSL